VSLEKPLDFNRENALALKCSVESRYAFSSVAVRIEVFKQRTVNPDGSGPLKHLAEKGRGENSLKALVSDLAYLEARVLAARGRELPWPESEALALKVVARHLFDPARRDADPGHRLPTGSPIFCARKGCSASKGRMRLRRD
jgi:hypothetical protein